MDQQIDFQRLQGDTTFDGVSVVIAAFPWLFVVHHKLELDIG